MAVLGCSILEVSLVSAVATVFTVLEHTPSTFWSAAELSHHEIHHNVCSESNFAQPFTPFLDYVFGTRYEDVMRRKATQKAEAKEGAKVE